MTFEQIPQADKTVSFLFFFPAHKILRKSELRRSESKFDLKHVPLEQELVGGDANSGLVVEISVPSAKINSLALLMRNPDLIL